MPFPGSAGSVWAADTWATDSWTDDSWDGSLTPDPEPEPEVQVGGGGGISRVSRKDVQAIERLLRQRGRIRASAAAGEAELFGTVRNPRPVVVPRAKAVPIPEPPPPPPEPRVGVVMAMASGVATAIGKVGFTELEQETAAMFAAFDPLYDWVMRELDL